MARTVRCFNSRCQSTNQPGRYSRLRVLRLRRHVVRGCTNAPSEGNPPDAFWIQWLDVLHNEQCRVTLRVRADRKRKYPHGRPSTGFSTKSALFDVLDSLPDVRCRSEITFRNWHRRPSVFLPCLRAHFEERWV